MGAESKSATGGLLESGLLLQPGSRNGRSVRALWRSVFREERFFLVLSVFIGILSGLAVVCFRFAIDWARIYLLGTGAVLSTTRMLLAPTLAGLAIAILAIHFFPQSRGSGVNQTKAALYIYNGEIPFRTAIGKFITAALAIGSGHSLGPEDPSLQIGACLASVLGRQMRLSRDRMRLIAPVGAAAGLAAAFNAPISAVLFVIEEVIGRWTAGILGSVVLSAVSSVVVMRWFLGFRISVSNSAGGIEAAYGVDCLCSSWHDRRAGVSSFFERDRHLAAGVPGIASLDPISSACGCGIADWNNRGIRCATGDGSGLQYIDQAMHGQFTWQFLAMLAGLKILATLLSFVTGTPGGMFAPTLFIGAMLGTAVGGAEHALCRI